MHSFTVVVLHMLKGCLLFSDEQVLLRHSFPTCLLCLHRFTSPALDVTPLFLPTLFFSTLCFFQHSLIAFHFLEHLINQLHSLYFLISRVTPLKFSRHTAWLYPLVTSLVMSENVEIRYLTQRILIGPVQKLLKK